MTPELMERLREVREQLWREIISRGADTDEKLALLQAATRVNTAIVELLHLG